MGLLSESIEILLPHKCIVCGRRAMNRDELPSVIPQNVRICPACLSLINPLPEGRRWLLCLSEPFEGDRYADLPLYMPYPYEETVSRLIKSLKFAGHDEIGTMLGSLLGNLMKSDNIGKGREFSLIVPIPLSKERLKERGYNQAELIAKEISNCLNIPLGKDILLRNRNTKRQARINNGTERGINISGAFELNESWSVEGTNIILVDDVVTSGNTMHEAASVLRDAGAEFVLCTAVCGNRNAKNSDPF